MEAISPRKPENGTNKTLPSVNNDIEGHVFQELEEEVEVYDYSKWLRAAALGVDDRNWDCPEGYAKTMILTRIAGLWLELLA